MSWQTRTDGPDPSTPTKPSADLEGWAIGQVCEETGLSPRTVRYYEELGLLPGVRRRRGGRRVYGGDECERLRFIQRLKALGLSLQEIKELNDLYALAGSTRTMLKRLDTLLESHIRGLDSRIDELTDLRDDMMHYRARVASRVESGERPDVSSSDQASEPLQGKERQ